MFGALRRGRRDLGVTAANSADVVVPPREAFVLAGGGSLGAAQVGALQAMLAAGITPDLMVGCSAGAFNAAFIAIDPTLDRTYALEKLWRGLTRKQFFPDSRITVARRLLSRYNHIYSPRGMRNSLAMHIPIDDLSQTAVPCHVVTTDLLAGREAWWSAGDAVQLLQASACLPGLFPPILLEGRPHVDGGVIDPVPVQRALDLGAKRVWVLDHAREWHGFTSMKYSALDILLESFAIARAELGRRPPVAAAGQRVVYIPPLSIGRHDMRDFSRTSQLIAAGREAGRQMIATEQRAELTAAG